MCSNISERTRRPALRRVRPPNRLLVPGRFHRRGQPVLRVLHLHHPNPPQFASCHHLSRLPHHRITRIIVCQPKDQPALPHHRRQRYRIFHRSCQRLVANHMNPCLQKRLRRPKVNVIRRNNRNRINPVRPLRLRRRHFRITPVSPLRRDMQLQRRSPALSRIGRQRPRHELKPVVHPPRNPVHRPNKRTRPPAHHPQPQPPVLLITRFRICCHVPFLVSNDCRTSRIL